MRYVLALAAALMASPASAACLPNAEVGRATAELNRIGIMSSDITDRPAVEAFLSATGWTGHVHAVVRLLFLWGRAEGNSMVFLVGESQTCQRMKAPTAAMRSAYTAANGVSV